MNEEQQLTLQRLAEMVKAGNRTAETRRQTKSFLEEVAKNLRARVGEVKANVGTRARTDDRDIQFLDRAYFPLAASWVVSGRLEPSLVVFITPEELWWGLFAWGSEELARGFYNLLQELDVLRPGEEPELATGGMTPSWSSGWYCALGSSLEPDELMSFGDVHELADHIANDLGHWHERLAPHVREIGDALGLKFEAKAWLFQANPEYFDLAAATDVRSIKVGQDDSWAAKRYRDKMHPGDLVVLWQSGGRAGIYALASLTSEPYEREMQATEEEIEERPYLEAKWWVDLQYTHVLDQPILRDELKDHPVLANMQVMRGPQGTNFRVTAEEWEAIEELVGKQPATSSGIDALVAALLPDPEKRRACLDYFANSIEEAHAQAPANWGVTVLDDRIRLNVGSVVVFTLQRHKIWLAAEQLSEAQRASLGSRVTFTPEHDYKSMAPVTSLYILQEQLASVYAVIKDEHSNFLARASKYSVN